MVQRTFYALPHEAPQIEEWAPAPENVHTLRHGYNLADLDRLTHMALRRRWGLLLDPATRYHAAWSAIAVRLYSTPDDSPPDPTDLIYAGQVAISDVVSEDMRHHGRARDEEWGTRQRRRFASYWEVKRLSAPDPSHTVVDRTALWQIWQHLTGAERRALGALAVHGDYQAAADALGQPYGTFAAAVTRGRTRFLRLWHEGETPSRPWGTDRRVYRQGVPAGARTRGQRARPPVMRAEPEHGPSRYDAGCRCDVCRTAIRVVRERQARARGVQPRRVIGPDLRERIYQRRLHVPARQVAAEFGVSQPLIRKIMSERRVDAQ